MRTAFIAPKPLESLGQSARTGVSARPVAQCVLARQSKLSSLFETKDHSVPSKIKHTPIKSRHPLTEAEDERYNDTRRMSLLTNGIRCPLPKDIRRSSLAYAHARGRTHAIMHRKIVHSSCAAKPHANLRTQATRRQTHRIYMMRKYILYGYVCIILSSPAVPSVRITFALCSLSANTTGIPSSLMLACCERLRTQRNISANGTRPQDQLSPTMRSHSARRSRSASRTIFTIGSIFPSR